MQAKHPAQLRSDAQPESATTRMAQPSLYHQFLKPMIGEWHIRMTTWPDGHEPAITSDQVQASKTWINDGLHVREEVQGPFGQSQHRKLTILGYNNLRQRFEFVTADNSDSVIMTYYGQADLEQQNLTLYGEYVFAGTGKILTGELVRIRSVFTLDHPDRHRLSIYYTHPARQEYLFLQYQYTRI
jgi:hypothetical protein